MNKAMDYSKDLNEDVEDNSTLSDFNMNSKLHNLKAARILATEITESGAKLYDYLGNEKELKILSELQAKQLTRYTADTTAANELNSVGIKVPPKEIPAAELASWTTVARTILNLHETITRH